MRKPCVVLSVLDLYKPMFFTPAAFERIRDLADLRIDPDPAGHALAESREMLREAEVVVTAWETGDLTELLPQMPQLRMVIHSGGSVKGVIGVQAYEAGVRISSQTQLNAEPVAEYSLAMIILAAKGIFASRRRYVENRAKEETFWENFPGVGLYGAKIGLIGLSRISRRVIEMLAPFHVDIKVFSHHLDEARARELGVTTASIDEIMRTCDVVSLHSASTPQTYHMLGAEDFAKMKDGATFINTARGAICDQDALIAELQRDRICAVIDVTDPEVNVPDSPLWTLPNVILTPHAAGSMGRELHRLGDGAIDDLANYIADTPVAGEFPVGQYAGRA
nr:hydroxyacid dehydrogenase [Cutibacterium avidum]